MKNKQLTSLQRKVAREIISLARRENYPAGHHLSKLALAKEIGTSHNPVESALAHLAQIGVARHERDRGYFLAKPANLLGKEAQSLSPVDEDPIHRAILDMRLNRRLPDVVTESDLMRALKQSRSSVRKTLSRILQEGWIERRPGNGWAFLPLVDTVEGYQDNYEMRGIIEPAGVLCPGFKPVPEELEKLKKQQLMMANGGHHMTTTSEWIDLNAGFHETIARWSGNRLLYQTLRHINRLRKLVEYRVVAGDTELRDRQISEHLEILKTIEEGKHSKAAKLIRQHLGHARKDKAQPGYFKQTTAG
jgi:DNA-binding GntR family transcriptional regulator